MGSIVFKIQDGGGFLTNQQSNLEFKMATHMKVGHVGKQPTSLNGELGSVSQISMATQITPGSRKNVT